MISLRDWIGAVSYLIESRDVSGAFNLCCPHDPDQRRVHPGARQGAAPQGVPRRPGRRAEGRRRRPGPRAAGLGQRPPRRARARGLRLRGRGRARACWPPRSPDRAPRPPASARPRAAARPGGSRPGPPAARPGALPPTARPPTTRSVTTSTSRRRRLRSTTSSASTCVVSPATAARARGSGAAAARRRRRCATRRRTAPRSAAASPVGPRGGPRARPTRPGSGRRRGAGRLGADATPGAPRRSARPVRPRHERDDQRRHDAGAGDGGEGGQESARVHPATLADPGRRVRRLIHRQAATPRRRLARMPLELDYEVAGLGDDAVDYLAAWDAPAPRARGASSPARAPTPSCCSSTRRSSPPASAPTRTSGPLDPGGADVIDVDRGGKITFHGPGQLVGYPIVTLPDHVKVVDYVRRVEEALIAVCADFGVDHRPRARAAAASGCGPTSAAPSARSPPSASGSAAA